MVESATLLAVMVSDVADETVGAVYRPEVEIVPTVLLPPVTPFTAQETPLFVDPVTLALNCCVSPDCNVAAEGVTETVTVGVGFTVTLALAVFVVSAALRAVIVNVVLEVSEAGAV